LTAFADVTADRLHALEGEDRAAARSAEREVLTIEP
jgi:hypothetical protein